VPNRFVFGFTKQGEYLPVGWWDRTRHNLDEDTFGLMSYVGKFSQGTDGSQEAINLMAAVLGATLLRAGRIFAVARYFFARFPPLHSFIMVLAIFERSHYSHRRRL